MEFVNIITASEAADVTLCPSVCDPLESLRGYQTSYQPDGHGNFLIYIGIEYYTFSFLCWLVTSLAQAR